MRTVCNASVRAAATVAVICVGLSIPAAGQTSGQVSTLPRTPDGQPDLQGFWQVINTAAWDIQDHPARLGVPAGQGVVEGNEIPYQPWALAKKQENFENRETADPETKCYMPGVPRITYMPYPFQILQFPDRVLILYEYVHVTRTVYMDGSPHPDGHIDFWMGDSRGRWEGDTLVVEVTNFSDRTNFRGAGSTRRLIERYTRVDADTVQVEITIDDPTTWTRSWTTAVTGKRDPDYWQVFEYACHEGNYGMRNILSAARNLEKAAAKDGK